MRVAREHLGKKGKCPACGTVNLIKEDSPLASNQPPQSFGAVDPLPVVEPLPIAEPLPATPSPPHPQPQAPTSHSFGPADFKTPMGSPYRSPNSASGPRPQHPNSADVDIPGILSVVFGGISLLGLCLCFCFGPIALVVVLSSIGGIVLAMFSKPPLKVIGLCLNGVALAIVIVLTIVAVAFFIFAASSTPTFQGPRFQGPTF